MEPVRRNRTERKKEQTRQRIVAVAIDLFNRQGFDFTTVEQIAEVADVAKGTIFNHFPAKEAIVHEYVQMSARETGTEVVSLLERLPGIRSRLIVLFRETMQWFERNLNKDVLKKYLVYLMQRSLEALRDENMRSGFNNMLTPVIRMGQEDGEIRRDIPAEELSNHLEWLSASIMIVWLAFPERSLTDILDREIDLFLSGALVRPAQDL